MRILALDAALARCSAAVVVDGTERAARHADVGRGHAALLAPMAEAVLAEADVRATSLDAVGVTVGPGGFTGLRAALSLAHGIAMSAGCVLVPVTVGEALAAALPHPGGRVQWTVIHSGRGNVYLEKSDDPVGALASVSLDRLPPVSGRVLIAGDAAVDVAARLAARGADVMLTDARLPRGRDVAVAAALRARGALPPLAALPLYVDPPAVRSAAAGGRPPPA